MRASLLLRENSGASSAAPQRDDFTSPEIEHGETTGLARVAEVALEREPHVGAAFLPNAFGIRQEE